METGSCLCQKIKLEVTKSNEKFNLCHCRMCQKFSGSAFGAYITIEKSDFRFVSGVDSLKTYESSSFAKRHFCSACGSSIMYTHNEHPEKVFLTAGILNGKVELRPKQHIFTKNKASWYEIDKKLPQCASWK